MALQPCLNRKISALRARQAAAQSPAERLRIAIVGVGQELRADDGAGVLVARALQPLEAGRGWLKIIDGGPAPEAYSGPLRRFNPHLVLLVDAAEIGAEPGALACFDWAEIAHLGSSTHTISLSFLAQYLSSTLDCEIVLAAIQPASLEFGAVMTPAVLAGAQKMAAELHAWLKQIETNL